MVRIVQIFVCIALLSITMAGAAAGRLLWFSGTVAQELAADQTAVGKILTSYQTSADNLTTVTSLAKSALTGNHANGDDGLVYLAKFVLQQAAQTSNVLRQSSIKERDGMAQLTAQSTALLTTSNTTVVKLGSAIDSVNTLAASLNKDTVPALNVSIAAVGSAAADVDAHAGKTLDASTVAIMSAAQTTNDLDRLIIDPSWHNTLLHMDQTTGSIADGAAQLDTALRNVLNPRKKSFWGTVGVGILKELIPKPYFLLH